MEFLILQKGYFPYLFNTPENRYYIGAFPEAHYFDPDNMKPEDRKKFLVWHKSEMERYAADPSLKYNLKEEMIK